MRSSPNNWLSDSVMNLLVDYYPEFQPRPYGSGATRENVIPVLRDLELGYICIYAKGHSGYTTWESSLHTKHRMLAQDMPGFFREVTRETNTKLVLYYSGLLDGIACTRNPDWHMLNIDGTYAQRFEGLSGMSNCPHSGYFDDWVAVHLTELIENYDPEGIWVDGDWTGPCYCPRCQKRFREETGWGEPWSDVLARADFTVAYGAFWNRVTDRWRNRFSDLIRSLKADCVYSAGNVSPRREFLAPFGWRSGDFFSPEWFYLHDIARMMRWYGTLGVPYDAYICDTSFTHSRPDVRSRSKTLERMTQEAAVVAANGGGVGYWTYPLGNGAFVPSRMEKAREVRRFLKEREGIFLHTTSETRTAVLACDPSQPTFGDIGLAGAHKALAALHHSPDVMDETGLSEEMPYDLIVVPEQRVVTDETARKLVDFVKGGGCLLSTGATINSDFLREAFGIKSVKPSALLDGHVLLKTHMEPTGVTSGWDCLELDSAEELYPLYLSWDQFNPEIGGRSSNWPLHGQMDEENPEPAGTPAAITRQLGKGRIVHVSTDLFGQYGKLGDPQMLRWVREMVAYLRPEPFIETDAPSWVDISVRRRGDSLLVHFVNQSPGRDFSRINSDDLWIDEIPVIGPFTLRLRLPSAPESITLEPGGEKLDCLWDDGLLEVKLPSLHIHACLAIR